jgi:hypothetical protein
MRWESSAVRLNEAVVIRFQNGRWLFFPSYHTNFANMRNKTKQAMVLEKNEGPPSVIHDDCQISLSDRRLPKWSRIPEEARLILRSTRNRQTIGGRTQSAFRWPHNMHQRIIDGKEAGTRVYVRLYFDVPQIASSDDIRYLKAPIVCNGELG